MIMVHRFVSDYSYTFLYGLPIAPVYGIFDTYGKWVEAIPEDEYQFITGYGCFHCNNHSFNIDMPAAVDSYNIAQHLYYTFEALCRCIEMRPQYSDFHQWDDRKLREASRLAKRALESWCDWPDLFPEEEYKSGVEALLVNINSEMRARQVTQELQDGDNAGYVYLIYSSTEHYKIGFSKDPRKRHKTFVDSFGVKLPISVELVHIIETNDMRKLETQLHERYKHKRVNGEWFSLDKPDVDYIKALGRIIV